MLKPMFKPMTVTAVVEPDRFSPTLISVTVSTKMYGKKEVFSRKVFDIDMFHSVFDIAMEQVINRLHRFIGENQYEKEI